MNIFTDMHHGGLYAAQHYLLENRLGHNLYRPIGKEWFTEGYWHIAKPYKDNPGTIEQYLGIRIAPEDGTIPLNEGDEQPNGIYSIRDGAHYFRHKAITLDKFKKMDIDIVIASIPAHIPVYKELIKKYKPNAKLVFHIGNIGWGDNINSYDADNIMVSTAPVPTNKHAVFYRQEFDLEVFKPELEPTREVISSFVHGANKNKEYWDLLTRGLLDYECNDFEYGIVGTKNIASKMQEAKYGYHNKPGGDGFGHVIHNWFAVGKPVIVNLKDYKDKLAGELMSDMITCIDMSNRKPSEVVNIINNISDLQYQDMCLAVRNKFKETVDYERDAANVKQFLENLK